MRTLLVIGLLLASRATASGQVLASSADTLPRRLKVEGNTVPLSMGHLCRVGVAADFVFIGGQRFELQETADAEQLFFVSAERDRTIRELLWLQVEEILPGLKGGYTYAQDSNRVVNTLALKLDIRTNRGTPPAGSDGAAMRSYVTSRGYVFPPLAPRLRMVHLPEPGGRREFMAIYLSALRVALPDTSLEMTLKRALDKLRLEPCRQGQ